MEPQDGWTFVPQRPLIDRPVSQDAWTPDLQRPLIEKPVEAAEARQEVPAVRKSRKWMIFVMPLLAVAVIALLVRNIRQLHKQIAQISQDFESAVSSLKTDL
jgi:hypothetical protein